MSNFIFDLNKTLNKIKREIPMVHSITNFVTMQDCANILTAIGASPVMAYYEGEVREITLKSKSLVLNTGTPDKQRIEAIIEAGKAAMEKNLPIILDPVGVGATEFRKDSINQILRVLKPSIIKGNVAEIKALSGLDTIKKGVDSVDTMEKRYKSVFMDLSLQLGTVIAVTGKEDFITDGKRCCTIQRGTDLFTSISGAGCMTSSVLGVFGAVSDDMFKATVYGIYTMNICGELAANCLKDVDGSGSFKVRLFDYINNIYKIENLTEAGVLFD